MKIYDGNLTIGANVNNLINLETVTGYLIIRGYKTNPINITLPKLKIVKGLLLIRDYAIVNTPNLTNVGYEIMVTFSSLLDVDKLLFVGTNIKLENNSTLKTNNLPEIGGILSITDDSTLITSETIKEFNKKYFSN